MDNNQKENWNNIHIEFTKETKKRWEKRNFDYETTKKWIKIGLNPSEVGLAYWITDKKNKDVKSLADEQWITDNLNKLRLEHKGFLSERENNWRNHGNPFLEFNQQITQQWIKQGFTKEQCQTWLNVGMKSKDAGFCAWLQNELKLDSLEILNNMNAENNYQETDLREQYSEYLIERWHKKGFTDEEISSWISVGLGWEDGGYAAWLRDIVQTIPEEYQSQLEIDNNDRTSREQWQSFLEEKKNQKRSNNLQEDKFTKLLRSQDKFIKLLERQYVNGYISENELIAKKKEKNKELFEEIEKSFYQQNQFYKKIVFLSRVAKGLSLVHELGVLQGDFHSKNIMISETDEGLMPMIVDFDHSIIFEKNEEGKYALETKKKEIFGVLPFVAPETLIDLSYSSASEIYSFGMIAYHCLTIINPHCNENWDDPKFKVKIVNGYRPSWESSPFKLPSILINLVERCWNNHHSLRPNITEVISILDELISDFENKKEFFSQCMECDEYNRNVEFDPESLKNYHPSTSYQSKVIDTRKLKSMLENLEVSEGDKETSLNLEDRENKKTEIKEKIKEIKSNLNDEAKILIDKFIEISILLSEEETDDLIEQIEEIEENLKKNGIDKKTISKLEDFCQELIKLEKETIKLKLEAQIEVKN